MARCRFTSIDLSSSLPPGAGVMSFVNFKRTESFLPVVSGLSFWRGLFRSLLIVAMSFKGSYLLEAGTDFFSKDIASRIETLLALIFE